LVKESLRIIEQARGEGLDITADVYPYTATNTVLSVVLPDWMKAGGTQAMLERLQDPHILQKVKAEWGRRATEPEQWEAYEISRTFAPENGIFQGQRLSEICRQKGESPLEAIARLLVSDSGQTEMMRFCIDEKDMEEVLARPWVMVGSDASAKDFQSDWCCPHPRAFGTFPRVLAEYVRNKKLLPLHEAIRKMTSLPAQRLSLTDRGRLAPGCKADIVIFDPEAVADCSTYEKPLQAPQGIEWVLVNGVAAVRKGELTGARPGKVLRSFEE
jgi:N-acyl-D-aspartate/D-glutamate deacylase